jgi:hypothetical protein
MGVGNVGDGATDTVVGADDGEIVPWVEPTANTGMTMRIPMLTARTHTRRLWRVPLQDPGE